MDQARTDGIDANASGGIFKGRTLGETEDAMLGGVVGSPTGPTYKSSNRGAIYDCAALLFEHLAQLEFHAAPYATKIDRRDAIEVFTGRISGVGDDILDAGIVVGCIQPAEGRDRLLNHGFDLRVIGDIALNGEDSMTLGSQLISRGTHGVLVPVGQRD